MKGLTLSVVLAFAGTGLAACAPRIQANHYERWASQDTQRKAEEAEEAKQAAAAPTTATPGQPKAAAAPAAKPPPPPPPPPPPGDGYNSLSGGTPPVQTATKTRAVKPAEDDDIY